MKLFEPGKIGKLEVKNRIVMAPMANHPIELDGRVSQRFIDYFVARAKGGVGLITTGACPVIRELEPGLSVAMDVTKDISWLSKLAEACHEYGAKVAVQLISTTGRNWDPRRGKREFVTPSAMPSFWDPNSMSREITVEEIERLVQAFGFAAEALMSAGIDAINMHWAHGYLADEFMTALWNKRTDKYGGDFEGRMRFCLECIQSVRRAVGPEFPIIFRLNVEHGFEGGRTMKEGLEILRRVEAAGVDAVDVDRGSYEVIYYMLTPGTQPPGFAVDVAEQAKKVLKIPVFAVGRLHYPDLAERVLQEGKADFITIGKQLIADPEWPNKVKEGRLEDIRPCLGCHEGCQPGRIPDTRPRFAGRPVNCAVNPQTVGLEKELTITPAGRKKSVLVVGGGPGGMEAAMVAAQRGHRVTLLEKGNALGGNLIPASVPDFKQDYGRLINHLSAQIRKLGVEVKLETEATPELVQKMKPDVVYIATGSTPIIPEIPGVKKAVTAVDVLLGRKEVGKSVVVIGGGMVGCETALYLAKKGKSLTIVEILDCVMGDMVEKNRLHMLTLLADTNVRILTSTRVLEIKSKGVSIADKIGARSTLEADTVVLAVGFKPNERLSEALKGKVPEVYVGGDCVKPRKVLDAVWEGFRTARLI